MKKYAFLLLSFIFLGFTACNNKQKQSDKNVTFQRNDFKVQKRYLGKRLNSTVSFYDLHKSNYLIPF